jgi:hypothetical protein
LHLSNFLASLSSKIVANIPAALASGYAGGAVTSSVAGRYYIPPINGRIGLNNQLIGTDWMAWATASNADKSGRITLDYKNLYEITTFYARILPSDFNMNAPAAATAQVWKFIVVNNEVVIFAERQTNAHERIPVLFGQPYEDGLWYQTKSLAENVSPIQDVTSSLINSVIAARRRAISDRGIYDPSRITEANINSTNPSAKIPVKPAAYGKPIDEAYKSIPFEDKNSTEILQQLGPLAKLADIITGQNPARQGQFVKGNKTQTEYSDVMSNSNGRDQAISLLYEAQVFTPIKEILKLNILQYQGARKILYKPEQGKETIIDIDPVKLREAVTKFKVSDGLTPTSKLISSDSFVAALQAMGSSPQIAGAYNIGPMFSYFMKTQNAMIADFEKSKEQVAYETALGSWQQMATLAIQKGQAFNTPQPTPEQFGYLVNGELKQAPDAKPDALNTFIANLATTGATE